MLILDNEIAMHLPKNRLIYYFSIPIFNVIILFILNYLGIRLSNQEIACLSIAIGIGGSILLNKSQNLQVN